MTKAKCKRLFIAQYLSHRKKEKQEYMYLIGQNKRQNLNKKKIRMFIYRGEWECGTKDREMEIGKKNWGWHFIKYTF